MATDLRCFLAMMHLKHVYAAFVIPLGFTLTAIAESPRAPRPQADVNRMQSQVPRDAPVEAELEPMTVNQPLFHGGQQPGTDSQVGAQVRLRRKVNRAAPAVEGKTE